jgi:hypothetical protein
MTAEQTVNQRVHRFNVDHPTGTPVLAWPGLRTDEPLRTRTRTAAWVLPAGEPVVSVVGYAGGIHLDHIEYDATRQPAVPEISFEAPPCPICGDALDCDGDGFTCLSCNAYWSGNGTGGRWLDQDATRCPATCRPLPNHMPDLVEQCVLELGHDAGKHRGIDGLTDWTDGDDKAVLDSEGDPV